MYYSIDLRRKVLNALSRGNTQLEVSKIFNIHRTTIYRWQKLEKEANNIAPRINHNIKKKKINIEKLIEYIDKDNKDKNYNKTLKEMAKDFGVSYVDIWYHLKKLGYVIKKN